MMYKLIDYYAQFWYKTDSEFEYIRQRVLNDPTNPNTEDFTKQRLVIEDQIGYGVIFDRRTEEPAVMCGLAQIQPGIGRMTNRLYVFPNYRTRTFDQLVSGLAAVDHYLLKPLYQISPFKTHVISAPNISNSETNKRWLILREAHKRAWPEQWYDVGGYVQTASGQTKRSWQPVITDNRTHKFNTITHAEWENLK